MQLQIRLFAGLAESFGASSVELNVEGDSITGARLKTMLAEMRPDAASLIRMSFLAKNQEYADENESFAAGDEIALIPPVSGGQGELPPAAGPSGRETELCSITEQPLSVEEVSALVADDDHGANIVFVGTTRRTTNGKRTVLLEYEAYVPMALKTMRQIVGEIAGRWPGARCAIRHRIGAVPAGEASVVIAVSTPHRADGYEASRYAIDRLKQIVPIWKKEIWEDGSEWKGPQSGPWNPLAEPTA